ncbi:MAG: hypothetical protein M3Y08_01245 [Fibrobacterota bacterium]|nr:hypothetical protein [Fibrobacterota bacterium]
MGWQDDEIVSPAQGKEPWELDELVEPAPASSGQAGGVGDLRMSESQPPEGDKSNIFPGALQEYQNRFSKPAGSIGQSLKDFGAVGLAGVGDVMGTFQRGAAAAFTDQKMSDPGAHALKNQTDAAVAAYKASAGESPAGGGFFTPGRIGTRHPGWAGAIEAGYRMADDPLSYAGILAKTLSYIPKMTGSVGAGIKKSVSELSQINPSLLEKAATPQGMAEIRLGAKIDASDLGQQVAEDAQKINRYREDLASNSRITQDQQVQSINDGLTLENQQVNAQAQDAATRVNEQRQRLAEASRAAQSGQVERGLLDARRGITGEDAGSLAEIQPGAVGEDLLSSVGAAKKPMQEAWVNGDRASLGPVREKPVATVVKRTEDGTFQKKKLLTQELAGVLGEFKALSPKQGMRKISQGATNGIRHLIGLSEQSGHNIDDLMNIRAELRRIRSGDRFEGNPLDMTTDDLAFGKAEKAIDRTLAQSVAKAAPKEAGTILSLNRAKDAQYATAKTILGDLAGSAGRTRNSAEVIGKVASMGPQKARAFIQAAEANPAIAGVVPKMRQAFIDDILLTSLENGSVNVDKLSKRWKSPKFHESKQAWLSPEDIKRVDDAIAMGLETIEKPGVVTASKIPMPAKIGSAADRSDGFYSQLAKSEINTPDKAGKSFSYGGTPDKITAETRVKNIGNEKDINKRAMNELKMLDKMNGTSYTEQAQKIYEATQLGMDASGKLSHIPQSSTGRSGLGAHMGEVFGFLVGGPAGFLVGNGMGAAVGAATGATAGRVIQAGTLYAQSPAGAVAAYKVINKIINQRWPKAARLGQAMTKTSSKTTRAALAAQIARELNIEASANVIPFRMKEAAGLDEEPQYTQR